LVKVRGKAVPVHTTKAYRGRGVQLHSFLTWALEGEGGTTNGQLHASAALPPQKETPQYLPNWRLGRYQKWSGYFKEKKKTLVNKTNLVHNFS
jgi:hypothetical protein